jgi:hypothetical protein
VAEVEGWRSVEELIGWGFAHAPVVMANQALPWPAQDMPGPIVAIPPVPGGYLAQPDMRKLMTAALELGWTLWAYEAEPLLVWCGNSHAYKEATPEWVPMGWHFRATSGTEPFVIDQTVTVAFDSQSQPCVQALLTTLSQTLAAYGGTAGILRDHAPAPLDGWPGVDAVVASTDNTLA